MPLDHIGVDEEKRGADETRQGAAERGAQGGDRQPGERGDADLKPDDAGKTRPDHLHHGDHGDVARVGPAVAPRQATRQQPLHPADVAARVAAEPHPRDPEKARVEPKEDHRQPHDRPSQRRRRARPPASSEPRVIMVARDRRGRLGRPARLFPEPSERSGKRHRRAPPPPARSSASTGTRALWCAEARQHQGARGTGVPYAPRRPGQCHGSSGEVEFPKRIRSAHGTRSTMKLCEHDLFRGRGRESRSACELPRDRLDHGGKGVPVDQGREAVNRVQPLDAVDVRDPAAAAASEVERVPVDVDVEVRLRGPPGIYTAGSLEQGTGHRVRIIESPAHDAPIPSADVGARPSDCRERSRPRPHGRRSDQSRCLRPRRTALRQQPGAPARALMVHRTSRSAQ